MKKILLLLAVAVAALSLQAAPVDKAAAQKVAKNYLANELYAGKLMAPAAMNPVLVKTEYGSDKKLNLPVYYIYNTSTTFLVVSAEDRAEEILMVGDEPLDMSRIPDGLQYLLDCYKEQIDFLHANPNIVVEKATQQRNQLRATTYGPLLTAKWDQESPYNYLCKFTYSGTTYTCYTGCPATSAAMVMYYWKYPTTQVGPLASYTNKLTIGSAWDPQEISNYTYPALEATTFDWANMKDTYTSYNNAQRNAVATLMRYVGQAEKMMYGVDGSGIWTTESQKIANMFKTFGYDSNTRLANKSSYSATNWANLIIAEMAAGRPVVYLGVDNSEGGHAFNVDGYRDSDSKYHVNFGWSGNGNNWYAMNAFTYNGMTFSSSQQAIVGIQPPGGQTTTPVLTVNPTSLTFESEVGGTVSKTFTVSGSDVYGDVSISVNSNYYTVSPTTLTKEQANAGATITVTYNPTLAGTHNATVTVSSSGAESKTVSLTGTASTVPTLTVNPTSLSFSTEAGVAVTKTFTVTGANLTGNVTVKTTGTGFSSSASVILKNYVNGKSYDVTVTYNPSSAGNHTGTITLSSTGAESKTVTLTGTATAPTRFITVSPSSLSFSTTTGQTVTKTFTVTGTNLTGSLNLELDDDYGYYDITPTSLTAAQAAAGATVTVTYTPANAGSHSGEVYVSGGGAEAKTVTLNGTATAPVKAINVNPTALSFAVTTGETQTKTFTVSGENLTGPVTLSLNNANGAYSITPTFINVNTANAGPTTVTVTYNPSAAGSHNASITIASSGADSKTVTLNGTATDPVRTITATPSTLTFNTLAGTSTTGTFLVTGENLTGNINLALNDANGVYTFTPSTITAAEAVNGKTVTVTYNPTLFGNHTAAITLSGGGATPVTVNLNGTATLEKYAPVMLPANQTYVALTQFRADWTDMTPDANVSSYTLEVTPKVVEPTVELLSTIAGTDFTSSQTYYDITLPAPWGGNNLRGASNRAIYFRQKGYQGATDEGMITYTVPAGYTNATFTLKITTDNTNDGTGNLTVATPQTAAVGYTFAKGQTYSWVVTASAGENITITSTKTSYSPDIALIELYTGDATAQTTLRAIQESGDANSRLIEGITGKYYTVKNLAEAGTFLYRVKAFYMDGSESDWSNIEEVTLFDNPHPYHVGDVNHDGNIDIDDVTMLIANVLNGGDICMICADLNGDEKADIDDVTTLIGWVLNGVPAEITVNNMPSIGR